MTNDNDKLRRLRKFLAGYGDLVTEDVFVITQEVDRLLNEPTSPAPAAAPSETVYRCPQCGGNCWGTYRATNGVEWGRCQGNANHGEVGDGVACGFVWKRSEDHLVFRAATAPAASPPVTSEAIERLRMLVSDEGDAKDHIALEQVIAAAIAEARGSSGLREALVELRKRLDLPGHAECPHPKECPWSDDHEMVAIIDRALAADAKEQTK